MGTVRSASDGENYGVRTVVVSMRRMAEVKRIELHLSLRSGNGGGVSSASMIIDDTRGPSELERIWDARPLKKGKTVIAAWGNRNGEYNEDTNDAMIYLEAE